MPKDFLGMALLALLLAACSSAGDPQEFANRNTFTICRPEEFAGYSMAVQLFPISKPLTVRRIKGMITYRGWEGSWGEYWPVLYLRSLRKSQKTYEIRGDATGRFVFKNLPPGAYCFLASASCPGYYGAVGVIIIDRKADPNKEIEIVLGLGAP